MTRGHGYRERRREIAALLASEASPGIDCIQALMDADALDFIEALCDRCPSGAFSPDVSAAIRGAIHGTGRLAEVRTPRTVTRVVAAIPADGKATPRKIGNRWQPVDGAGEVIRRGWVNTDGEGYSSRAGCAEACEALNDDAAGVVGAAAFGALAAAIEPEGAPPCDYCDNRATVHDGDTDSYRCDAHNAPPETEPGTLAPKGWDPGACDGGAA